jgi:hypothetical protein
MLLTLLKVIYAPVQVSDILVLAVGSLLILHFKYSLFYALYCSDYPQYFGFGLVNNAIYQGSLDVKFRYVCFTVNI